MLTVGPCLTHRRNQSFIREDCLQPDGETNPRFIIASLGLTESWARQQAFLVDGGRPLQQAASLIRQQKTSRSPEHRPIQVKAAAAALL